MSARHPALPRLPLARRHPAEDAHELPLLSERPIPALVENETAVAYPPSPMRLLGLSARGRKPHWPGVFLALGVSPTPLSRRMNRLRLREKKNSWMRERRCGGSHLE